MKKTMKYLSMAALALVGAVMTSCSSGDDLTDNTQQPWPASGDNVVTLTTTVSIAGGETRALAGDGTKTFAADETMAIVYKNTSGNTMKVVSEALTDGDIEAGSQSATFTFTLTDPDRTQNVTYIYPAAMAKEDGTVNYDALATQDGTLSTLSSTLDLATYSGAWVAGALPTATLDNPLAILAITLKNSDGTSDITSTITGMTISDGTNDYAVNRSAAAGPIYVAIRPTSSATIDVTATDGTKNYTKTLAETKTYEANNGYPVSWRMTFDALSFPLTFEAETAGATVTFTKGSGTLNNIEYNVYDGNGWQSYTYGTGITLTNVGDKISFRGDNAAYSTGSWTGACSRISCSKDCYIYGNIMSLVSSTNFVNAKALTKNYAFCYLFNSNSHIVNHPSKTLALPATTLTNYCYSNMFNGCSQLTTAPALPATTLAQSCYQSMFFGCSNLTTAPVLPATKLVSNCYYYMFKSCTNLSSVTCYATDISATSCTSYWLDGVAASGTFTTPSSTDWSSKTVVSGIPSGWTRVDY